MERKKTDQLWHRQDVLEAQLILSNYTDEDSKVIFTSSGEKYDSVPNHQAVTDMNADAKTLRIGTAWEYCHYCKCGLEAMEKHGYKTEAKYLHDHYLLDKRMPERIELKRLNYSGNSYHIFDALLPLALKAFADECPAKYFKELFNYVYNLRISRRKQTVN